MEPFSPEVIAQRRDAFRKAGLEEVELHHNGRAFRYFVIPAERGPADLPNFAMRLTPETAIVRASSAPEMEGVFGISSAVQKEFRRFAVTHEIIEFMDIGIENVGRCAEAAHQEIQLLYAENTLPEERKKSYLTMRREFFRNLINFALRHPDSYDARDHFEFQQSYFVFESHDRYGDLIRTSSPVFRHEFTPAKESSIRAVGGRFLSLGGSYEELRKALHDGEVLVGLYDSPLGGTTQAPLLDQEQFLEWGGGVLHDIQNLLGYYAVPSDRLSTRE